MLQGVNEVIEPYSVIDSKALKYVKKHLKDNSRVIIFGYTHKSQQLCKILKDEDASISIYESDEADYQKAKDDGFKDVFYIDMNKHTI